MRTSSKQNDSIRGYSQRKDNHNKKKRILKNITL